MRLATVRTAGGLRAARVDGTDADAAVQLLAFRDVRALLEDANWSIAAATDGEPAGTLGGAELAPLVPSPSKILCLGLNYRSHITELGRDLPSHPTLFGKDAQTLLGPRDDLVLPSVAEQPDWEAELAIVVGARTRRADVEQAAASIAGYTMLNDVSMRDWQWRTTQWLQGKMFEQSTPLGPVLVTADELPHIDGRVDVRVTCRVDGELKQDARTRDLLFSPAEIVSYVSTFTTLNPGDVIATGTPGGVGSAATPPVFLRPGQTVVVEGEGIGACVNRCTAERLG